MNASYLDFESLRCKNLGRDRYGSMLFRKICRLYAHLSPEFKNNEMNKLQLGLMNSNGGNGIPVMSGNEIHSTNEKKVDSEGA